MKTELIRTDSSNPFFQKLVGQLDAELAGRNGEQHAFYSRFNKIDLIKNVVIALRGGEPVGCGAFKFFGEKTVEVKRMFVPPGHRGQGIAGLVLMELENWAAELGHERAVLETGRNLPEAIALYSKRGYRLIENFGQYSGVENSVCFEKRLG